MGITVYKDALNFISHFLFNYENKDKTTHTPCITSEALLNEITSEKSFTEKSKSIMGVLRENSPEMLETLDHLKETHNQKLENLKEHGWSGMKSRCNMTRDGYELYNAT